MGINYDLVGTEIQSTDSSKLEKAKFFTDTLGYVRVRTSAEGTFTPTGLKNALKVTNQIVTDVVTPIPIVPLSNRNAMSLYNKGQFPIYIGNSDVTSSIDEEFEGWIIDANGYMSYDITDNIVLYAVTDPGKSSRLKIKELS
jgi:hypothetical protein